MIVLALTIVALVLAAVAIIRSRGDDLAAWAVAFLAVALLWGQIS